MSELIEYWFLHTLLYCRGGSDWNNLLFFDWLDYVHFDVIGPNCDLFLPDQRFATTGFATAGFAQMFYLLGDISIARK
jgi:hypothetical protein